MQMLPFKGKFYLYKKTDFGSVFSSTRKDRDKPVFSSAVKVVVKC